MADRSRMWALVPITQQSCVVCGGTGRVLSRPVRKRFAAIITCPCTSLSELLYQVETLERH